MTSITFRILIFLCVSVNISLSGQIVDDQIPIANREVSASSTMSSEELIKDGQSKLKTSISEEDKFEILIKMSGAFLRIKNPNYGQSTELLFQAKTIAERLDQPILKAKIYTTIANQYSFLNFPERIKTYLDLAKAEIDKIPNGQAKNTRYALLYLEYGNLDADKDQFLKAKKNYQLALKEFQKNKKTVPSEAYHYQRILYNLGVCYNYLKQNDSAEFFLNKSLLVPDLQQKKLKFFINNSLAKIYAEKLEYQRAVDTLQSMLSDSNFNDSRLQADVYKKLVNNYKALGNHDKYIFYNDKLMELSPDLHHNVTKAISTAVVQEQQSFKNRISQTETANKIIILLCFILIVGTFFYIVLSLKKRKKEKCLYENLIRSLEEKKLTNLSDESVIFIADQPEISKAQESFASPLLPKNIELEILQKLDKFEKSTKFTNPKLSVASLAVMFKTNPTYLSETIRKYKQKNFNNYINELRIHYICGKIKAHPEFLNYKISYLAEVAGFSSHSTFTTIFKTITGISPSAFLRETEKGL